MRWIFHGLDEVKKEIPGMVNSQDVFFWVMSSVVPFIGLWVRGGNIMGCMRCTLCWVPIKMRPLD